MTNEEKANNIATNNLDRCFGNKQIYGATCALEMAAWKEQQMIEKMINWLALHAELYGSFNGGKLNEMAIAMKKAMED